MQEMELGVSGHLTYRIDVATGSDFGAGTDANLFCTLIGDTHRSSGEFQLAKSLTYANKFERGQASTAFSASIPAFTCRCNSSVHMPLQVDAFEWRGASLGEIHAVTIRTDGSGLGADWQLDRVTGARRCLFEVLHAVTLRQ
jgi:hypothetical protein